MQGKDKMYIPVKLLEEIYNPFKTPSWSIDYPITNNEIETAIKQKCFESCPIKKKVDRVTHIRRIAYFVVNGWKGDILLEPPRDGIGIVSDGNHRLAAAIHNNQEFISVTVFGRIESKPTIAEWASEAIGKLVEKEYNTNPDKVKWVQK